MATLTRLASTLTAKYFPSQTLTDAFYIDGRLFGKREARQADITIDKEERGFFFSVFAHPVIPEYEIGTLPPYEPQLRGTCNDVKFGRKEIDGMIEGFLATAVDVTGKMKLNDNNDRAPYFAGVIVRDAEAFAVTIGTGLAFLYRDDTLFPLTDAGIPMEPIDSMGNRVGDFMYYCSSKTANALWSNFFTLSPDDCIILCNKEIYDALGQREILRILAEAEDQCDAAGVIITQASARMPNVPMQFSISFVESVTNEDKKGLFGFRKKNKEEDMSSMSIESTTEGGVVGAASAAIADAGFTSGLNEAAAAGAGAAGAAGAAIMFGDKIPSPAVPSENQVASADKGIELDKDKPASADSPIEFLDTSVSTEPAIEVSAEEALKNLFEDSLKKEEKEEKEPEIIEESPFVAGGFNPFDADSTSSDAETPMETVSSTPVILPDDDADKTKPIEKLDTDFLKSLEKTDTNSTIKTEDIIQAALKELSEGDEVKSQVEEDKKPVSGSEEIVFSQGNEAITFDSNETEDKASAAFDPYGVGDGSEMQNAVPLVFGDDGSSKAPTEEELKSDGSDGIPVPDFEIETPKPELKEDDKLSLDFPETAKASEEKKEEEEEDKKEEPSSDGFALPFENPVETISDEPKTPDENSDIPDMPVFDGNTFDTPVNAVSSEQPINAQTEDVISYGQYVENENMAAPEPEFTAPVAENFETADQTPPYQSFGNEGEGYAQYDNGYQYQPGQYQSYDDNAGYDPAAAAPAPEQQAPAADNDWINAILGIDDEEDYASAQAASYDQPAAAPVAAATATAATASAAAPAQRRPGGAPASRPQGQRPSGPAKKPAQPASGMGGGKGPFGGKKLPKLNRNGYMFLAFVAICLIVFIVLISAIVRSCGKKVDGDETEETTTTVVEETTTTLPVETTAAPADPNGPIGVFVFSDTYTGYRTWYDLFDRVYDIQIENESDPRIARVIQYNGFDPATYPNPSDFVFGDSEIWLYLPPADMLDPNVELVPYNASAAPEETTAAPEDTAAETAEETAAAED